MDYPDECADCGKRGDVTYCNGCSAGFCNNHLAQHELLCDAGSVVDGSNGGRDFVDITDVLFADEEEEPGNEGAD